MACDNFARGGLADGALRWLVLVRALRDGLIQSVLDNSLWARYNTRIKVKRLGLHGNCLSEPELAANLHA